MIKIFIRLIKVEKCRILVALLFALATVISVITILIHPWLRYKLGPSLPTHPPHEIRDISDETRIPFQSLVERAHAPSQHLSFKYCGEKNITKPWFDKFGSYDKLFDRQYFGRLSNLTAAMHQQLVDYNITHFISSGTLLGSLFFHDYLPWDDDTDFFVLEEDLNEIMFSLNLIEGVICDQLVSDNGNVHMLKVYFDNHDVRVKDIYARRPHNYFWSMPYIDIFIVKPDPTRPGHYIQPDWPEENVWHESTIFPLHMRPLGSLWLPSPAKPYSHLQVEYSYILPVPMEFPCRKSINNHYWESTVQGKELDCDEIAQTYPVVTVETPEQMNTSVEVLMIDGQVMYTCHLHEEQAHLPHPPLKFPRELTKPSTTYMKMTLQPAILLLIVMSLLAGILVRTNIANICQLVISKFQKQILLTSSSSTFKAVFRAYAGVGLLLPTTTSSTSHDC